VIHFVGRDWARLHEKLEAVDGWPPGRLGSIDQLVDSHTWKCDNVTLPLSSKSDLADGGRSSWEAHWRPNLHSAFNS